MTSLRKRRHAAALLKSFLRLDVWDITTVYYDNRPRIDSARRLLSPPKVRRLRARVESGVTR